MPLRGRSYYRLRLPKLRRMNLWGTDVWNSLASYLDVGTLPMTTLAR